MEREIPKAPPAPPLDGEAVQLLTQLCFGIPDDVSRSCEAVFIFGASSAGNQHRIVETYCRYVQHQTAAKTVYIAGGRPKGPDQKTEAQIIAGRINPRAYPGVEFRLEEESKSTLENVVNCLRLGLRDHRQLIFIAKAHSAGRSRLTLAKYLPDIGYSNIRHRCYDAHAQCPDPKMDGAQISIGSTSWQRYAAHRDIVWGEFLRIEKYGSRGDIAYPPHIRALVEAIREIVGSPPAS